MGEKTEEKRRSEHKSGVERARESYEKKLDGYDRFIERREKFLEKNDERLAKIRERDDDILRKRRERSDDRISKNRKAIEERIIKGDSDKQKRFEKRTNQTDEYIAAQRKKRDEKIRRHRDKLSDDRKRNDKKVRELIDDARVRERNKLRRIEEEKRQGEQAGRNFRVIVIIGAVLFVLILACQFILPGTALKKAGIIDDTPIEEVIPIIPSKEYKEYDATAEITSDQLLWSLLMEHFNQNETATLGVMCNLKAESNLEAGNLEDYNNGIWNINDEDYTEKVNRKTIDKNDFMQSRVNYATNGYYNTYNQWVNKDGGYGYAQYTSYDKKESLYQFAEQWFGPGGQGENYKFNIGDPEMQAHFIVHLLESDEFSSMDNQIKNAATVVDACYIWLKKYEIPYDPYNDNYYTLAFDRAASADTIRAECAVSTETPDEAGTSSGGADSTEASGEAETPEEDDAR